ncbi:hypothetical protein ACTIVE_1341 [Actinomadura verrucosospora]|uniref:Uncharacterized protein n=1 Tax=Actinomadura verrucosospora TaxID=46165 RepID=A0A7D4A0P5_ACTVE|nr:hypothetical protein ACTIVE_1341 [Actinomadura verrucosospora]
MLGGQRVAAVLGRSGHPEHPGLAAGLAALVDRHLEAALGQFEGRREAGDPGTEDRHVLAGCPPPRGQGLRAGLAAQPGRGLADQAGGRRARADGGDAAEEASA